MKPISFPSGLTKKTINCLTKAGIPIEKKAIIKALKNGTLYPHRKSRNYGKYTHREVCRCERVDPKIVTFFPCTVWHPGSGSSA